MSEPHSPPPGAAPPHAAAIPDVLARFGTDPARGLTEARAAELRARHGPNELAEAPPVPRWRKLFAQFNEVVIWLLIVAAAVSASTGDWAEAIAILAIVVLNALLGFFQEERAGQALAALRRLSTPHARVRRDGLLQSVPARELVPGDLVELEVGDHIPADARLVSAVGFRVQESALTGESNPVDKDPAAGLAPATPLGDRRTMAYLGTVAAAGKASAVVVATGMATELGRIAGLLQAHEGEPTPLQRRLGELGRVLSVVCLVLGAALFGVEWWRGRPWAEVLLLAVSLAVAAVPEGLPAVVTVVLTVGLQRLARRHALVRRLPSVETLGCVTVICSDKTGTLTRNEMTVRAVLVGGRRFQVTGSGYQPVGQFLAGDGAGPDAPTRPVEPRAEPDLSLALTAAARCNASRVAPRGDGSDAWQVVGDPTEGALLVAALKAGIEADRPGPVLYEIPFDSDRKAMSVVVRAPRGPVVMFTKGAPEVVLNKCRSERRGGRVEPLTDERRRAIMQDNAALAADALRVLGLAYREYGADEPDRYREEDLVFAGLVGMIDPPREEVKEAVRRCHVAGIRPVMITGDHPETAAAIARELLILRGGGRVLTGADLDALTDDDLASVVEETAVYARVTAEHKLRVVRAWKRRGQVVAMTGDGVNDAPAVRAADIGIAMGVAGTDVTKEASDLVLTDDNFASIVNAVEEGRGIYDNIQKFLQYLLAGNLGLIFFVLVAVAADWPFPLTALQILWMNLVTNGLPALALGLEPPEPDLMRRRPRPPGEPIITGRRAARMAVHGALVAAVTAVAFALEYRGEPRNLPRARTEAFCVVSFSFILYALACRSLRYTLPELGLFSNPYLLGAIAVSALLQLAVVTLPFAEAVFESAIHLSREWVLLIGLALVPVSVVEVTKIIRNRRGRPEP